MAKRTFSPRACTKCGETKGVEGFYAHPRYADGFTRICRSCSNASSAEWQRKVRAETGKWPSQSSPSRERERRLAYDRARYPVARDKVLANQRKYRYGIEHDDVLALLTAQGGKCAICDQELTLRSACVDHCHDSGTVRGLLCRNCNFGLGHFRDDPTRLTAALAYLSA